ncbi:hypothetical protein GLOTRDRAFT_120022 [Gloeophyllum trabeum ATCC 11539]|uniref:U4/U6.U5 small nuclear ribonucleoprotein 27kDa protein domain-containing protein n=1 Tax=Gloeophyllum trabeum (strain ATCC 11539 / FP-39264 / Madison 617) TaxID=670483 RepID=S7QEE6_GLOTA|nr:uncharacterized protein GLOTRDRAFT_120022 [Gloeophyllum trabeum ATCC 11539]EPQ58181.1 hypothetical protein GLOTRDRAFT_120022 [Gloeophyllum trabeum ATCC 11539]
MSTRRDYPRRDIGNATVSETVIVTTGTETVGVASIAMEDGDIVVRGALRVEATGIAGETSGTMTETAATIEGTEALETILDATADMNVIDPLEDIRDKDGRPADVRESRPPPERSELKDPTAPQSRSESVPETSKALRSIGRDESTEPADGAEEGEAMDDATNDDDAAMMAMMGLTGFGTTKGKHVEGNQEGAVDVKKMRTWRQYMNRRGGFNRPLDKIK